MSGRVKRKAALVAAAARPGPAEPGACALCGRALGRRVEWHHRVPKSRGGTETAPVHPICHRTIHACLSNTELASIYADWPALRAQEGIARFLRWIGPKPADFDAPTRRSRPRVGRG